MYTANMACGLPSWEHIGMVKEILLLRCEYRISIPTYRANSALHSFDINEKLGGTSFKQRHENWQHDQGMGEDFSKWAAESFGKIYLPSMVINL
jgi:hypothetical protein